MVRKPLIVKLALLILILALVAGCSSQKPTINPSAKRLPKVTITPEPTATAIPEAGLLCKSSLTHIRLPDASDLSLSALTQISILEFPDLTIDAPTLRMIIEKGKIIIQSPFPENVSYILESPQGTIARINSGYLVVEYDEENQEYFAYCLNGLCEMGPNLDALNVLKTNHTGVVNQNGEFTDLGEITTDDLISGCEDNHLVLEIPATPTPDIDATATAFCGEFQENNPGTPCP